MFSESTRFQKRDRIIKNFSNVTTSKSVMNMLDILKNTLTLTCQPPEIRSPKKILSCVKKIPPPPPILIKKIKNDMNAHYYKTKLECVKFTYLSYMKMFRVRGRAYCNGKHPKTRRQTQKTCTQTH